MPHLVLVGTYTEPVPHVPHADGPGILTLNVSSSGVFVKRTTSASIAGPNPSYLAIRYPTKGRIEVFAVNEVPIAPFGTITRLRLDSDGSLTRLDQAVCGRAPAHVAILPDGGVVAGCFGDGSVSSFAALQDGRLEPADSIRPAESYGAGWSGKSSVHMTLPIRSGKDEMLVFVCDPTADRVSLVACGGQQKLEMKCVLELGEETYPRHAVQALDDREVIYVALAKTRAVSKVQVIAGSDGSYKMQEVEQFRLAVGSGTLGAIQMDGRNGVLVSERGNGCDRIWHLVVSGYRKGEMASVPSGGEVPRDFCVGKGLVTAVHQMDGSVCVADMEHVKNGAADAFRKFAVGGFCTAPVCAAVVEEVRDISS